MERRHDQVGYVKLLGDLESKIKELEKDYFFMMRTLDSLAEEVFKAELANWKRGTATCSQLDAMFLYFSSPLDVKRPQWGLNRTSKASLAFEFLPIRNHDTIKMIRMFSSNTSTKKVGLDWHNGARKLSESGFGGELEETTVKLNKNEHIMQMNATTGPYSADVAGMFTYTAIRSLFFWIVDMETLQCRIVECGRHDRETRALKDLVCNEAPMTKTDCHIGGVFGTRTEPVYTIGAIYVPLAPHYLKKLQKHEDLVHYRNFLREKKTCGAKPLSKF
jgi:hypothetical protein